MIERKTIGYAILRPGVADGRGIRWEIVPPEIAS
jgi:hypothetical protein